MARSPVTDKSSNAASRKEDTPPKPSKHVSKVRFNRPESKLLASSRLFRHGYRYALHKLRNYVSRQPVRIVEKLVVDETSLQKAQHLRAMNDEIIRENSRLKCEKQKLQETITGSLHREYDLYETSQEYMALLAKYDKLREMTLKSSTDILKPKVEDSALDATEESSEVASDRTHVISDATPPEARERFSVPRRTVFVQKGAAVHYEPVLESIGDEELPERPEVAQLPGQIAQERPRRRRQSCLLSHPEPASNADDSVKNTPRKNVSAKDRQRAASLSAIDNISDDVDVKLRLTPDKSEAEVPNEVLVPAVSQSPEKEQPSQRASREESPVPASPVKNGKRSHQDIGAGDVVSRRSVAMSPRPSLQRRSMRGSMVDPMDLSAKRLCFGNEDSAETSKLSDVTQNEAQDENQNEWVTDSSVSITTSRRTSSISSVSVVSMLESETSRSSSRPSRAAKDKIASFKEPDLISKMRRPDDVPALTPGQDRRKKGSSKSKKSK